MLNAATDVVGIILAGGMSSRMGKDKALLSFDREPLLLRARNTLLKAGCREVFLSGYARPEWDSAVIPDQFSQAGPVGGIVSTLQALVKPGALPITALFVPVDTPLLSSELLASMLAFASGNGCHMDNSPLPVVFRTTVAVSERCAEISKDFERGRSCSVKRFNEALNLHSIHVTNSLKQELTNVNTPQEWEGFRLEFENRT